MDPGSRVLRVRHKGGSPGLCVLAALMGYVLAPVGGVAQQIYKWTDSQGQVHYSDHAEAGQASETVKVQKAPPKPVQVAPEVLTLEPIRHDPAPPSPAAQVAAMDPIVLRNMRGEGQAAAAAKQKAADKVLVANCKANRESFCNDVAAIKSQQAILNEPPPPKCRWIPGLGEDCRSDPPPKAPPVPSRSLEAWQHPLYPGQRVPPPPFSFKKEKKKSSDDE